MKGLKQSIVLILIILSGIAKAETGNVVPPSLQDSLNNEHQSLFYRVGENQMMELLYREIFGEEIGPTTLWLNTFADNALTTFSQLDYLVLENNNSGGFELFDEDNNYVSVAPDFQNYFSLTSNTGTWVKSRSNGFNKIYFSTNTGKEFTMIMKISIGGKKVIRDEKGYEITLKGKLTGSYDIWDNEGRKMKIKIDRSGVYRLIEDDRVISTMVMTSMQNFTITDSNGIIHQIRMRGRYNDIIITSSNGSEIFINNRYEKPLPPTNTTETNESS